MLSSKSPRVRLGMRLVCHRPGRRPPSLFGNRDTLIGMERPASVTLVAALFFLVAAYLVTIGVVELLAPGTLSMTRAAGITYGRELNGAQTAFSLGAGWVLIGWGLYP